MKKINYKDVNLSREFFSCDYHFDQARKAIAVVAMTNEAANEDPDWVSDVVPELTRMLKKNPSSFYISTAGIVVTRDKSADRDDFYKIGVDLTNQIYEHLMK